MKKVEFINDEQFSYDGKLYIFEQLEKIDTNSNQGKLIFFQWGKNKESYLVACEDKNDTYLLSFAFSLYQKPVVQYLYQYYIDSVKIYGSQSKAAKKNLKTLTKFLNKEMPYVTKELYFWSIRGNRNAILMNDRKSFLSLAKCMGIRKGINEMFDFEYDKVCEEFIKSKEPFKQHIPKEFYKYFKGKTGVLGTYNITNYKDDYMDKILEEKVQEQIETNRQFDRWFEGKP